MLGVSVLVPPLCEGDSSSSEGPLKQTRWEGGVLEMGRVKGERRQGVQSQRRCWQREDMNMVSCFSPIRAVCSFYLLM